MTTTTQGAATAGAQRAYRRRQRRHQRMTTAALVAPGRPVGSALTRIPFIVVVIAVLGAGVAGVLWFNTKSDESGIETVRAQDAIAHMHLTIESLNRDIADLDATPRIAAEARQLGLVPAGDAAILIIDGNGNGSVVGTPAPVPAAAGSAGSTAAGAAAGHPGVAAGR